MNDFFDGMRLLGQGLKRVVRRPKRLFLGLLPALLSLVLFAMLFAVLLYFLGDLAEAASWYADGWSDGPRTTMRVLTGIAIFSVSVLLAILSYTGVTLAIGDPFYEAIAESIEDELGGVPGEVETPLWSSIMRSLGDTARLIAITVLLAIPLLVIGLIPVVGQLAATVLGALIGGWFLSVELSGVAFSRRGLRLAGRRKMLKAQRKAALGFGVAVFLCFLIPLGAVLLMPAAVAGGTLLARRAYGLPLSPVGNPK